MRDYADLIKRLNEYSAEHEMHGGITAEAADAIEELCREIDTDNDAMTAMYGAMMANDAVPVRHGRWNVYSAKNSLYTCSVCNHLPVSKTPYCPFCGAKMENYRDV